MQITDHILHLFHLSGTQEKIIRNLFWAALGKIVTLLGSLFVGIIVARYLGPENYGLMNYVISYVALFQVFAFFGLDNIEIRETARTPEQYETIVGTAFTIKAILAVITVLLVIATSWMLETDSSTTALAALYSVSVIANTLTVIRNYFTAKVQNEPVVKSEIAQTLIGASIKVGLLLAHAPLPWFVAASAFDVVLLGMGYCVSYRRHVGALSHWRFDPKLATNLLKESFPLLLTSAAVIIYQRIDQVMIGQIIDKESVGFFSVASRLVEILIYLPMILVQTVTPILVQAREKSEHDYRDKAQRFMNVTLWGTLLVAIPMSLCSYWIILLLFGQAYLTAVPILQVLSFKAVSVALSTTAGHMIIVEGLQRVAILRDTFGCLVCILLNLLLLPHYGVLAAAFVAIASNVAAGYIADAVIPSYRHLFVAQTRSIFTGWRDLCSIKQLVRQR